MLIIVQPAIGANLLIDYVQMIQQVNIFLKYLVCNPFYADNNTRTCVTAIGCTMGFFADNSTWRCVPYCPNNSYAHPTTKICQQYC